MKKSAVAAVIVAVQLLVQSCDSRKGNFTQNCGALTTAVCQYQDLLDYAAVSIDHAGPEQCVYPNIFVGEVLETTSPYRMETLAGTYYGELKKIRVKEAINGNLSGDIWMVRVASDQDGTHQPNAIPSMSCPQGGRCVFLAWGSFCDGSGKCKLFDNCDQFPGGLYYEKRPAVLVDNNNFVCTLDGCPQNGETPSTCISLDRVKKCQKELVCTVSASDAGTCDQ